MTSKTQPDRQASIVQALAAVARDVRKVEKNGKNNHFNYAFQSLDDVLATLHPILAEHGVVPMVANVTYETIPTGKAQLMQGEFTYRFYGPTGDYLDTMVIAQGADTTDKAASKMQSQAYKKVLCQVFTIPTGDVDPDSISPQIQLPTTSPETLKATYLEIIDKAFQTTEYTPERQTQAIKWASNNRTDNLTELQLPELKRLSTTLKQMQ